MVGCQKRGGCTGRGAVGSNHAAIALLAYWQELFSDRHGRPFLVFPGKSPTEIQSERQFQAFIDAAQWIESQGYPITTAVAWKGYVQFACDYYWKKGHRPSPRHLMQDVLFKKYCQGENQACEPPAPQHSAEDLFAIYQRSLGPRLRDAEVMELLGLQKLSKGEL